MSWGRAFRFGSETIELVWRPTAEELASAKHFVDEDHALRFVRGLLFEPGGEARLRSLIAQDSRAFDQRRLVDQLAHLLLRRAVVVLARRARPHAHGAGAQPQPPRPPSQPPPHLTRSTFIEIELVDETGRPVAGERYKVTDPSGKVHRGTLDARGQARIDRIRPGGPCDVEFPDLHGEEWS